MTVPLARNEAGRQGGAEANGRSSLKAPKSVRAAEKFSRTRLSQSFFMRDFLFSEIAAIEGLSNMPDDPELAIAAGRGLCENLLEPLQATFGRIAIRSAYRSPEVNDFGCRHRLSCASNERNRARAASLSVGNTTPRTSSASYSSLASLSSSGDFETGSSFQPGPWRGPISFGVHELAQALASASTTGLTDEDQVPELEGNPISAPAPDLLWRQHGSRCGNRSSHFPARMGGSSRLGGPFRD